LIVLDDCELHDAPTPPLAWGEMAADSKRRLRSRSLMSLYFQLGEMPSETFELFAAISTAERQA